MGSRSKHGSGTGTVMHSGSSSDKAKVTVPAVPVTQLCSTMPLQKNFYFIKQDGDYKRYFTVCRYLVAFLYFLFFTLQHLFPRQGEVPDKLFLGISNSAKVEILCQLFVLPSLSTVF